MAFLRRPCESAGETVRAPVQTSGAATWVLIVAIAGRERREQHRKDHAAERDEEAHEQPIAQDDEGRPMPDQADHEPQECCLRKRDGRSGQVMREGKRRENDQRSNAHCRPTQGQQRNANRDQDEHRGGEPVHGHMRRMENRRIDVPGLPVDIQHLGKRDQFRGRTPDEQIDCEMHLVGINEPRESEKDRGAERDMFA